MVIETEIASTDSTFNPWWVCVKVSDGCENCYASSLSSRWGHDVWGHDKERCFSSESNWNQPLRRNRMAVEAAVPLDGESLLALRASGRYL